MSKALVIENGTIVDPKNGRKENATLLIKDQKVVDTLTKNERENAEVIDASGLLVTPGLIDIHVHFREPGQTHKEDIESGSYAAAAGGFTTVVCMPNTTPVCDSAGTIRQIQESIKNGAIINVHTTGCLTKDMAGKQMAPIGALAKAGVVAVTDDGKCVQDNELMRAVLTYAKMFDLPIMDHCQDEALTRGAVMNEGDMSTKLGLTGWPKEAEDIIVARNAILSKTTGARVHCQHLSSKASVEIIRRAKEDGIEITGEASPHHISLEDKALEDYNTSFKMNPPLRTAEDREALIEGLLDGTIDCIATDHAPHADYEKAVEFTNAPFGIIGLETSFAVSHETLVASGRCSISDLIALMTYKGAELINLDRGHLSTGAVADVALIDPTESWTVSRETLFGKSTNTPWLGKTLTGRIRATIVAGKTVYKDGFFL
ncbi:MAG: dihydroorotase [Verrucomicrobiota bacterium]